MDKFLKRAVWLIILAPAVYLAITWNTLPDKVALHFDLKGNIDKYGDKSDLLYMVGLLTLLNAGVFLLLKNIYRIDPKKNAGENKGRFLRMAFAVCLFVAGVLCLVIYSSIHLNTRFNSRLMLAGMGILFSFIGNYLHNIKPNYFAGLRLPWTLENEENWRKTHALAGKLWFAGGILCAIVSLLLPTIISFICVFTILMIMVLVPCIYSYRLYKKQKALPQ